MVDVRGQAKAGIGTPLVGGQHQFTVINLELYKGEARCLVAFGIRRAKEQHIVLTVPLLFVDASHQRRQLLEVGGVTVHKDWPHIVPPGNADLAVLLHIPFSVGEQFQFAAQFLPGEVVPFEDVEQVAWCQ